MKEIKQINKISLANITAFIYGLIGFFIAISAAISTMANIVMQKDFAGSVLMVTLFNIGAGLLLGVITSLVVACFGWLIGYLSAIIYNMFVRWVGGIKIELVDVEVKHESKKLEETDNHDKADSHNNVVN